jgi:hypothetical protein
MLLGHVVGLGHLLGDEELLDLLLSAVTLLNKDVLHRLTSLVGNLSGSRALLVTNVRKKTSDNTNGVVKELLALSLISGDAINAKLTEGLGGTSEHVDVVEQVVDENRLHNVQLELTSLRGKTAGEISTNNLEASLVDNLRNNGVDLTGHDGAARSARRKVNLMETATRTRGKKTEIVTDLRKLDSAALQDTREVEHTRGVGRSVNEIGGNLNIVTSDLTEGLDSVSRVVRVSSSTSTNGSTTEVDAKEHLSSLLDEVNILLKSGSVSMELLTKSHGDTILKLSTTHLHDVLEFLSLLGEGVDEELHLLDHGEVVKVHTKLSRGRVGIVSGLALVDDIVGANELVVTTLVSHDLKSTVGNDFVGVHVGRSTSTTLNHINDELRVPLARNDFIASLHNSLSLILRDETETVVGSDGSLLDHTVGLNVVGEIIKSLSGDIIAVVTTHGLDTVVVISRNLKLTEEIRLSTGSSSADSNLGDSSKFRGRLSKSEHSLKVLDK